MWKCFVFRFVILPDILKNAPMFKRIGKVHILMWRLVTCLRRSKARHSTRQRRWYRTIDGSESSVNLCLLFLHMFCNFLTSAVVAVAPLAVLLVVVEEQSMSVIEHACCSYIRASVPSRQREVEKFALCWSQCIKQEFRSQSIAG